MPACGVPGAPVETASIDRPAAIPDGSGGAIIVYQTGGRDGRQTHVQRIGPDGGSVWGEKGAPLFFAPGSGGGIRRSAEIAGDGSGGAILVWAGEDAARLDVQRVSPEGRFFWEQGARSLPGGGVTLYMAIGDGFGGMVVAWGDPVRIQRIDGQGRPLWPAAVVFEEGQGRYLNMTVDRQGNVFLVWDDSRYNVLARKLGAGGDISWLPGGVQMVAGEGAGKMHSVVTDGAGGAIVAWETAQRDQTGYIGGHDAFAQRVDARGRVLWQADGLPIARAVPFDVQAVEDGAGGVLVVWRTDASIYAQRIDGEGNRLWQREGIEVWDGRGSPTSPVVSVAGDDAGGAIVVWHQARRGSSPEGDLEMELRAQRLGSNGQTLWGNSGTLVFTGRGYFTRPVVTGDGSGGVIIAWGAGTSLQSITSSNVQRIDPGGNPRFGRQGVRLGG